MTNSATMPLTDLPQVEDHPDFNALVNRCQTACRSGIPLLGLGPVTAMRCRALLYAQTALAAMEAADSDKVRLTLERLADAYLQVHDRAAGIRWYSLPGTSRSARQDTARSLDNAMLRAELRRISDALVESRPASARRAKPAAK